MLIMHTSECVAKIIRNKNMCAGSYVDALASQVLERKGEVGLSGERGEE